MQTDFGKLKVGELTAGFKLYFKAESDVIKMSPMFGSITAKQKNMPSAFYTLF